MADLQLRRRARAAQADPEARLELLRELVRSGQIDGPALQAAAHAGDPLAGEVLGLEVELPWFGDRSALTRWLCAFEPFGPVACQQVAVAVAGLEATAWARAWPLHDLASELRHWSECPCIDHVRGVEQADGARLWRRDYWIPGPAADELAGLALGWVTASLSRRAEPSRCWRALWARYRAPHREVLPRLVDEVTARVSAWAHRGLP